MSRRIVCLALVALLLGCQEPPPAEIVRPVRAVKVGDIQGMQGRWYPGRAEAVEEVELSFRVSGPLIELPIKVGDRVKKDSLIAAVDPTDFQTSLDLARGNLERSQAQLLAMERGARPEEIAQLRASVDEAKAMAAQAKAEFDRNAKLVVNKVVSQSEYDLSLARRDRTAAQVRIAEENLRIGLEGSRQEDIEAKKAEIQSLQATVIDARNKLRYTRLLAPFDGEVAARYAENFQTIQAAQPIARLLDTSKIKVTVQIPESAISLVPLVDEVSIQFDALPNREFAGRITEVGTEASRSTRTYPVTVQIDQQADYKVHPGMAGRVRGKLKKPEEGAVQVVVPSNAIFTPNTQRQSHVWVFDEASSTVSLRPIVTGELTPGGVKVLKGLKAGEWVVTAGVSVLQDGQKVKLLQEGDA